MAGTRKRHSASFKAKVALEAAKQTRTVAELTKAYQLHPVQISQWQKQLLDGAESLFRDGRLRKANFRCHDEDRQINRSRTGPQVKSTEPDFPRDRTREDHNKSKSPNCPLFGFLYSRLPAKRPPHSPATLYTGRCIYFLQRQAQAFRLQYPHLRSIFTPEDNLANRRELIVDVAHLAHEADIKRHAALKK
jgi:transposase-like protein